MQIKIHSGTKLTLHAYEQQEVCVCYTNPSSPNVVARPIWQSAHLSCTKVLMGNNIWPTLGDCMQNLAFSFIWSISILITGRWYHHIA